MTDQVTEFNLALAAGADRWVPACGGLEQVTRVQGRRLLYCYNPSQHRHAYLDLDQDLILEDYELPECLR